MALFMASSDRARLGVHRVVETRRLHLLRKGDKVGRRAARTRVTESGRNIYKGD